MKISFIGSGSVATTIAYAIGLKNICEEIVMLDIDESYARGKSIDLEQGFILDYNNIKIKSSKSYVDVKNSDIIIITAGASNKTGTATNRESLLGKSREIISEVAGELKRVIDTGDKQPLIIMVTNPLDAILKYFIDFGFNKKKTVGSGNLLDTARFKYYLSREFNVPTEQIETMVIGQHGEKMVYLLSQTLIKGRPLNEYIGTNNFDEKAIVDICNRSTHGAYEILSLIKSGGTMFGPSNSTIRIIESYLEKNKEITPMSVHCNGEYGFKDCCMGLPVLLGKNGVEKIEVLELSREEKKELKESHEFIMKLVESKK